MYEKLQKILWHEIGHLCIDIILVEKVKFETLAINELKIFIIPVGEDIHCWGGHVKILPEIKYERAVKEFDYLTLKLMALSSGCIFETIYSRNILKKEEIRFENCFGLKVSCNGKGDKTKYNELIHHLMKLNDQEKDKEKIRGNHAVLEFLYAYIPDSLMELAEKNSDFLKHVEEEVDNLAQEIYGDYEGKGKPDDYTIIINSAKLNSLIQVFNEIINETDFISSILYIENEFCEKMGHYIK